MELEAINAGILSIVPPVVAIVLALVTKRGGILPRAGYFIGYYDLCLFHGDRHRWRL